MTITAVANVFRFTNRSGYIWSMVLAEGERYFLVPERELYSSHPLLHCSVQSCNVITNENEETILILFRNHRVCYNFGDDFENNFVQFRIPRDSPGFVGSDNLNNFNPSITPVGSMILMGAERLNTPFADIGFSMRDALGANWRTTLDNTLDDIRSTDTQVDLMGNEIIGWEVQDDGRIFATMTQQILFNFVSVPFSMGLHNVFITLRINFTANNGLLDAEIRDLGINVQGNFQAAITALLREILECRMDTFQDVITTQMQIANNTLQLINANVNDVYLLPGNQIDYNAIALNGWNISVRRDEIITGDTHEDVTVVMELI